MPFIAAFQNRLDIGHGKDTSRLETHFGWGGAVLMTPQADFSAIEQAGRKEELVIKLVILSL